MNVIKKLEVKKITNFSGLELEVMNYGATIKSLKVPNKLGGKTTIVVGLNSAEEYCQTPYEKHQLFLGSSIGRYAGRLSGNCIEVENKKYEIYNESGVHLHGGREGFDKKIWNIENIIEGKSSSITMAYTSRHLEEGYPGNLKVRVKYELHKSNALRITYEAISDRTTLVNLTNHAYFNLNGKGSILNHNLKVNNTHHLEVNDELIPTGKLINSENTRFDFKVRSIVGRDDFVGFDDTFVLKKHVAKAIELFSPSTGIKMEIFTNQPALVIYTPKKFPEVPINSNFSEFPAICFEAQNFPDAPNNIDFPRSLLKAGKKYVNRTTFNFEVNA